MIVFTASVLSHWIYNDKPDSTPPVLPFASAELTGDFHDSALHPFTERVTGQQRLHDRSLYACIHIYNRLPQDFVDESSISRFQSRLTQLAKTQAALHPEDWRQVWQSMAKTMSMLYGS